MEVGNEMRRTIALFLSLALLCLVPLHSVAEEPLAISAPIAAEMSAYEAETVSTQSTDSSMEEATALIEEGIRNMDTTILIYDARIPGERASVSAAVQAAMNRNPRFFYVETQYSYSTASGYAYAIYLTYNMTEAEVAAANQVIDRAVAEVLTATHSSMNDAEKALAAHDYIAAHYEYDTTYENYTLYEMVRDRQGVCQGYSWLYMEVLGELGIPCEFVASAEHQHAWNIVEIGGTWYHVDITHDDPLYDLSGRVYHTHFLVDEETLHSVCEEHTGHDAAHDATDNSYALKKWANIGAAFLYVDGKWYTAGYESYQMHLYVYDAKADSLTRVYSGTPWTTTDGSGIWPGAYCGLFAYDDTVIFNLKDGFYQYVPETGATRKIYDIQSADGFVYGSFLTGDTVTYCITTSPNNGRNNATDASLYATYTLPLSAVLSVDVSVTLTLGEGSGTTGTVTVESGAASGAARVMVAAYDDSNRMIGIGIYPVTLEKWTTQTVNFSITGENPARVQAMIFDSNAITPLAPADAVG